MESCSSNEINVFNKQLNLTGTLVCCARHVQICTMLDVKKHVVKSLTNIELSIKTLFGAK